MSRFAFLTQNEMLQHAFSDKLLIAWNIVSALSLLVPAVILVVARATTQGEDEDEDRNRNNENYYDQYGNYVGPTPWWQFWKKNNNYNYDQNNDRQDEDEAGAPWWYVWGQQEREPEEEGSGTIMFVFVWTALMLIGLSFLVHKLTAQEQMVPLRWALIAFANYCFICCVMLGGLEAIRVEGREIEETGWYGQTSVMLFMTCLINIISCISFAVWTVVRERNISKKETDTTMQDSSDYHAASDEARPSGSIA